MTRTCASLAGIVILSAGLLAAWSVPQAEDPAVLLRAALSAVDAVYLADFDPGGGKVTGEARKLTTRWDGVSG